MVSSSEIPSGYTLRWDAGIRQAAARPPSADAGPSGPESSGASRRKYCSSCNSCRRSRVKCSGGNPCQRCTRFPDPASSCVYSVSQRHGKRRASSHQESGGQAPAQQTTSYQSPTLLNTLLGLPSLTDGQSDFSDIMQFTSSQSPSSADVLHSITPNTDGSTIPFLNDPISPLQAASYRSLDFLGTFPSPVMPISPHRFSLDLDLTPDVNRNPSHPAAPAGCACYLSNHTLVGRIDAAIKDPNRTGLDKIFQAMEDASAHVSRYLACERCDSGCPRLVNLAMLHQRQVSLLCNMAKNPAAYLGGAASEGLRFALGGYRLSEEADLDHKRMALLGAARRIDGLVTAFDDRVRSYQDAEIMGEPGIDMTEAARLNLRWLLDVARNLKSRLKVIVSILENANWATAEA